MGCQHARRCRQQSRNEHGPGRPNPPLDEKLVRGKPGKEFRHPHWLAGEYLTVSYLREELTEHTIWKLDNHG